MNRLITQIISGYTISLGKDYTKYFHHTLRIYSICQLLDPNSGNQEKYAIASAFHDIGIWTAGTFDYLKPSEQLAEQWLVKNNKSGLVAEISMMIGQHHKMSPYTGQYSQTVETFRKADWTDLSLGLIKYGLPAGQYRQLRKQFPTKGFHWFLVRKTLQNFLRHPLRPLPMFKK